MEKAIEVFQFAELKSQEGRTLLLRPDLFSTPPPTF